MTEPIPVITERDTGAALLVEAIRDQQWGVAVEQQSPPDATKVYGGPRIGLGHLTGNDGEFTRRCLINRMARAPEGTRNRTLYGAVKDAAHQGDLDDAMIDALTEAAQQAGLDYKETVDTIISAIKEAEREAAGGAGQQADGWSFVDGASFILDIPDTIPALWGTGQRVLWAEGESLMIASLPGLGKTTLAGMLISAQLGVGLGGIEKQVLGLPVARESAKILYLAMDRPAQIARSLHRQFHEHRRDELADRLAVWKGPPPADIAKNPALLAELAAAASAGVVYLDSVKDAAIGLSDDAVGAGYNRARQLLLSRGVQLCELHHTVKRSSSGGPPGSIADVFGSAWIINGCGSIIMLTGEPGDPIVGFRHLRQPAEEVGPLILTHDESTGTITILSDIDPVALAREAHPTGITARGFAVVMFDKPKPTRGQIEKGRKILDRKVDDGDLRRESGSAGGQGGGTPTKWFLP